MAETAPQTADEPEQSWLRRYRYPLVITVCFVIVGAITTPLFFPDIHLARSVIGGGLFGVVCSFCAVMPRLLE